MKKFCIDPGHGGNSIGASYKGRKEQDDCLRLSLAVKEILLTQKDVEVMLSREDDTNPSLEDRAREANAWGADYFISVHRNAFAPNKAQGVEAWVFSKVVVGGITFSQAEEIVNDLCAAAGFVNRGVKLGAPSYTDYAVNRLTNMSSCLLEVGFIDSDSDNAIFDAYFADIALSIAKSLLKNVGLEYIPPVIVGDVDGDGKVTAADARLILRASVGLEEIDLETGDIDGDGKITSSDARAALRISTGLEE
ncbi:MAG: N-acetylmuramoyl-L-alanine amidase [Clostridia bacterium]|nr:N-acetylmuramoyl-L-alanine amidase [Clostridia bacterium]